MMWKAMKIILMIIAFMVIYKCLIAGHAMPILHKDSISEYRKVVLNGVEQSILIRGKKRSNPILLFIHGGPGNPETPFIVPYQRKWEDNYTVVNWDQRGGGRSYQKEMDRSSLHTEQICQDAIALTEYLKKEFQVEKIYLVGHSYGTYVGMKCIQLHPENYYAYVGIGQVGNQQENEKYLLEYAKKEAEREENQKAVRELVEIGELPYNKYNFESNMLCVRKWTTYFRGAIHNRKDTKCITFKVFMNPEYSLMDMVSYLKGEKLYYGQATYDRALWELYEANLQREVPKVEVPITFIQGENDYITSYEMCSNYFNSIEATDKKLITLSKCGHYPMLEKTEEVSEVLIQLLQYSK